jgi:hypothetical protein
MRPPMLQWKVFLALLAVVLVGVTLGSVLGPATPRPVTTSIAVSVVGPIAPVNINTLPRAPKGALFILGRAERRTLPQRLLAWLDRAFNK